MKVLHVIPSFAPAWRYGGPVRAAYELCREQARQGADVTVFTTNIDGPWDLDVELDRAVPMDGFRVRYFQVQSPRSYSFSLPLARSLQRSVADYQIVHIHSVFNWPIVPAGIACRRHGIPYVVRPCGILDSSSVWKSYEEGLTSLWGGLKKTAYLRIVESRNLNAAAGIHFTSEQEMRGARWARVRSKGFVCPLGVAAQDPKGLMTRKDLHLPATGTVVLFLSRLDPKKGLDLLIQALAPIAAGRSDLTLAIAGEGDRRYETDLRALVDQCGMRDRTVWFGAADDRLKWSLLHASDVLALPSHAENFGLVVVEALAAGLPVLVSDQVAIHPEVAAAGAGLVTACDAQAIRKGLLSILDHPQQIERMRKRGRALAEERYSWSASARSLLAVYEDVVAGRSLTA